MAAPAVIGHLDADAFYVSCERVRCAHLQHLPVGVLGNQGACVIARSYEMRTYGVKTGTPVWEAKKLCPEGVYVKRDFRWYEVISRRLLEELRRISPAVEYYSIDEMFFDASHLSRAFGGSMGEAARALQRHLLEVIGVPVSIGLARSKTLAKLGSDSSKPLGCAVLLEPKEIEVLLARLPVQEISGIAERSRRKLALYGILNCLDFTRADRKLIRRLLTIKGEQLWWELRGTSVCPLVTTRPAHKMLNRGGSMGRATADPERVLAFLVRNLERLIEELDYYQVLTEEFSLALRYQQGGSVGGRLHLPEPTDRFDLLLDAGKELLRQLWGSGVGVPALAGWREPAKAGTPTPGRGNKLPTLPPVNGMHLLAGKLQHRHLYQGNLFAQPNPLAERIAQVKRFVNERVGRFAVRSGATLPLRDIYEDEAQQYDICDVRGKMCF